IPRSRYRASPGRMLPLEFDPPCNRRTNRAFWSSSGARFSAQNSFVAPLSKFHVLKDQRLHVTRRWLILTVELPCRDVAKFIIVTKRLPLLGLVFYAKMASTRFIAFRSIQAHEFRKFEKIRDPSGMFQRLAKVLAVAQNVDVLPELFANSG